MTQHTAIVALDRASQILTLAAQYIRENCDDAIIHYDSVDCDGTCLADDCESMAADLKELFPRLR
jgi:hypothetical protein